MTIEEIVLAELEQSYPIPPSVSLDIARVTGQVKNYCHLSELPQELNFTIADMVLDLQKARTGDNLSMNKVDMGDTSYSFNVDKAIDGLVKNYQANLNTFRKLRW